MKKLMIAAAIVCAAAMSQAAQFGWSVAGAAGYSTYSVFVLNENGCTSIAQIKGIVEAGGLSAADDYAAYTGGTVASNGGSSVAASTSGVAFTFKDGGSTAENTRTAFILFVDEAGTVGSYTATKTQVMANDSTAKTWAFGQQSGTLASNSFTVAPEPTSALLMLLGVAGLALKRKRA